MRIIRLHYSLYVILLSRSDFDCEKTNFNFLYFLIFLIGFFCLNLFFSSNLSTLKKYSKQKQTNKIKQNKTNIARQKGARKKVSCLIKNSHQQTHTYIHIRHEPIAQLLHTFFGTEKRENSLAALGLPLLNDV